MRNSLTHQMRSLMGSTLLSILLLLPSFSVLVLNHQQAQALGAYDFPSTNDENSNSNAPRRPSQPAPFVEQIGSDFDSVTLTFKNPSVGLSCFEYRTDGNTSQETGTTHPFAPYITDRYPHICLAAGAADVTREFFANGFVEVRHAFGGENDWFFDWTIFNTMNPDPTNSHQLNLSGTLYRDHRLNDCDNKTECEDRSTDLLSDWDVRLYKELSPGLWEKIDTKTTNESGVYKFATQHDAGTYHVCEVVKPGWTQPKQTWSGSGYLVDTDNLSGDSTEGPYCTSTIYTDQADRSSKSNIGNVDITPPEDAYFTSPPSASVQNGVIEISAYIEDYGIGLGQQQIVMRRPNNSIAGNWTYNVKTGTGNVLAGSGVVSYVGDSHAGTLTITLDTTTLADGQYNLRLFTKDAVVNGRSNIYRSFFINNTPPTKVDGLNIVINGQIKACGVNTNTRTITVNWDDIIASDFSHYEYQADANQVSPYDYTTTVYSSERTGLIRDQDGTYNYRIRAVDAAGNHGEWSDWCSVTLDRIAPLATITSHSDGERASGLTPLVGKVVDENPYYSKFSIRNSAGTLVASSMHTDSVLTHTYDWNSGGYPDDVYTIYFEAHDKADNMDGTLDTPGDSVDVITITVDNTTLVPTAFLTSVGSDQSPDFEGTAEPGAVIQLEIDGIIESTTVDTFGDWVINFSNEFIPGNYTAFISATDVQDNSEATSLNFTISSTTARGGVINELEPTPPVETPQTQNQPQQPNAPNNQNTVQDTGIVLGATTDDGVVDDSDSNSDADGEVLQSTTDELSPRDESGCYKIFGACWYWSLIVAATLLGFLGYLFASHEE